VKVLDRLGTLLTLGGLLALALGRLPADAQVTLATIDRILAGLAVLLGILLAGLAVHLIRNQTQPPYEDKESYRAP
jgi:hypothetical protein